jgi:hypothetical protein
VPRLERGELLRLRCEVARTRLRANAVRQEMIQALGDWLCGGGPAPTRNDIQALADLCEAHEVAQARYRRCIAALSEDVVARVRRA